jgi:hypothetical protein
MAVKRNANREYKTKIKSKAEKVTNASSFAYFSAKEK